MSRLPRGTKGKKKKDRTTCFHPYHHPSVQSRKKKEKEKKGERKKGIYLSPPAMTWQRKKGVSGKKKRKRERKREKGVAICLLHSFSFSLSA